MPRALGARLYNENSIRWNIIITERTCGRRPAMQPEGISPCAPLQQKPILGSWRCTYVTRLEDWSSKREQPHVISKYLKVLTIVIREKYQIFLGKRLVKNPSFERFQRHGIIRDELDIYVGCIHHLRTNTWFGNPHRVCSFHRLLSRLRKHLASGHYYTWGGTYMIFLLGKRLVKNVSFK